jgi:hypothetical protein
MATNITTNADSKSPKAGRRQAIDNGCLWGDRDALVWLLETNWADVGWNLRSIKSAADVRAAFQVCEQYQNNRYYVLDTLLRASEAPATPKKLNALRRRIGELSGALRDAYDVQEKCRESLARADRALAGQWSETEKEIIQTKRNERAAALADADGKYQSLQNKRKQLEDTLRDSEAYFARAEVVRFCKSRRYSLDPLNTANALAGLPLIGWRQSMKRCRQQECPGANGSTYQAFKIFRQIVESCRRRSDLINQAERWLKNASPKSYTVVQLRKDWYYLRRSLKAVMNTKLLSRALPYAILRDYLYQISHKSAADLLFEEDEQLVV